MIKQELKPGTIKRIHVNRQILAANRKQERDDPPISVQMSGGVVAAHIVVGPDFRVVHAGEARGIKALSCGARVWIETRSGVTVIK